MLSRTFEIKNITLKNRIAIPPMVCFHWAGDDGYVTEKNIDHYRQLAQGGAGLIIVEATAISKRSRLHETELGLWEDGQTEGFRKITDVIHAAGAYAFIQLVHAGGNGIDKNAAAPSAMLYRDGISAHEMTKDEIMQMRRDFVSAALRAKAAGFDGVEIHGCHGYLLSCFFSSKKNLRTDEYGTDRSLAARQVLEDVRNACGKDFIVGIRLAAFEPKLSDGMENAKAIAPYTDFLDISYGVDCEAEKPEEFPCSHAVYGASVIKKLLPNMPVFGVDKITCREDALYALGTGIDVIDVGRSSLVDPSFANHILNDEKCGKCLHCNNYCRWNPPTMADEKAVCPGRTLFLKENKNG